MRKTINILLIIFILITLIYIFTNFFITSKNSNNNYSNNTFNLSYKERFISYIIDISQITPNLYEKEIDMNSPLNTNLLLKLSTNEFNNKISITTNYSNTSYLNLIFSKCGINSILGLESIYLQINNFSTLDTEKVDLEFLKSCTDWIGPYIVQLNNIQGEFFPKFTGGWHGTNGDSTGNITAYTKSIVVLADNKEILAPDLISCNKINLIVTNYIKGYNTTKDIIKETVYYTIYNNRIDVFVEIESLFNITIKKYYGLQTQNSAWQNTVTYVGKSNTITYDALINSNSGNKKENNNIYALILTSKDHNHKLTAWLDKTYGLGTQEKVSDNLPSAFTTNYGKSYFNLINGEEIILNQNEKLYWRGGYIFNATY